MGVDPSVKFLRPSRLPKRRQQVAAVCYRIRTRGIEILLVQTRGGRWTFPKGGVEPGLTHAQSAALEAFEEAGVHGRMEEIPFARYFRRKPDTVTFSKDTRRAARSSQPGLAVTAHLCEVSRLEPPQESNRNPTWFLAEKAKQRLLEDRAPEFGAELARVVDRALSRIQRLYSGARNTPDRMHRDGLQKVRLEAHENGRFHDDLREAAVQAHLRKVLQIGAPEEIRPTVLRLGAGAGSPAETARNITAIDGGRRANLAKPSAARTDR
jgi:8-oxo-dGTP pyrophosphatase MutT (NUDIX family)